MQNPNAPNKDNYCTTEFYPRSAEDYVAMGYNAEIAHTQAEADTIKHKEFVDLQKAAPKDKIKAKHGMTKEEQEELLQKMGAYAVRADPEITA